MNVISNILYWISTGLLVPVIVLLIFFFIRSIILIGAFFGQYLNDKLRGEKRCVGGRDERGLGDWFGGQGVGRGLVVGGGKTKRFTGVKRSWQTVCT